MKTIILITIDTELSNHKDDFGILGRFNEKTFGLPKFLEVLSSRKMKATFFVDVYSGRKKYLPLLKSLCEDLKREGHDLELHTHPDGIIDQKRGQMRHYSLEEQIRIVHKGKELFHEWFGEAPIAHRAGDWGANSDTLEALMRNGILCDSSMFYRWRNCDLNQAPLTRNRIASFRNLIEIPATCYQTQGLGIFYPYRLLSTDGNSLAETIDLIEKIHISQAGFINLVYHSFSFLKWNKRRTAYSVDYHRIKKFERLLDFLKQNPNYEIMTIKDFYAAIQKDKSWLKKPDVLASNGIGATALRLLDRMRGN